MHGMVRESGGFMVAWLMLALQAPAQQLVWQIEGVQREEHFGFSIATVADRDGDGIRELLVGAPAAVASGDAGHVRVLSGATLVELLDVDGGTKTAFERDRFGESVAAYPDLDGDGLEEILVGRPQADAVELRAGGDGRLLASFVGSFGSAFGTTLVVVGDIDLDGVVDFATGAANLAGSSGAIGVVQLISGASGSELGRVESQSGPTGRGVGRRDQIAAAGDLDGDGLVDLALLDLKSAVSGFNPLVRIVSGLDGSDLMTVVFDHAGYISQWAVSIAGVGDVNRDGFVDVLVGTYDASVRGGPAVGWVVSGRDGKELARGNAANKGTRVLVAGAGDVNGDGTLDFAVHSDGVSSSSFPKPGSHVFSGLGGAPLHSVVPAISTLWLDLALLAGVDLDGDAISDVAFGLPNVFDTNGLQSGALESWTWGGAAPLQARTGDARDEPVGPAAILDDVDGDGRHDVLCVRSDLFQFSAPIELRSGLDGSLLAQHPPQTPGVTVAAMPDLDGDGHGDYALAFSDRIELRGSTAGALIRTCVVPAGSRSIASALVAAIEPTSGALRIAVGYATSSTGRSLGGEVLLFDGATGAQLFQKFGNANNEQLGAAVIALPDVTGDGVLDWACGAPFSNAAASQAGRVAILSGATFAQVKVLFGTVNEHFGSALARVGDANGDGVEDLAVGAPDSGAGAEGAIHLIASGGSWTVLNSYFGSNVSDRYGRRLVRLGDVNRDGVADWATTAASPSRVELNSGVDARPLAQFDYPAVNLAQQIEIAAEPDFLIGSVNGDRIPDLLITGDLAGDGQGRGDLFALDDLMLQIDPPSALPNTQATATLTGGPASSPAAFELVTAGGVPVGQIVAFGTLNLIGEWTIVDTIPPGLSGLTIELRGLAIGFNGKLMKSPVQPFTFE